MRNYIITQLQRRFKDADTKGFEDFCMGAAQTVITLLSTETEADVAVDILLERLSIEEYETTYGSEYPGQYNHHGYPTAYDKLTVKRLRDNAACALLKDKDQFGKLIKKRLAERVIQSMADAQKVYSLLRQIRRVMQGSSADHWEELRRIARNLCYLETRTMPEDILLGGWRLDEEKHGGYETCSENREQLGQGFLLHTWIVSKETTKQNYVSITKSVIVQAWRQDKKVIFLALEECAEDGYVGIDNHYGVDTTWEVLTLRAIIV